MNQDNFENLENKILDKIKAEHIRPKSVWYFILKDYSLWSLVFLSVILGAIAISPIIFIFQNLELGYAKHITPNIFTFVLFMLPYGWILLCAVTTFFATLAWERTKNGYKFDGRYVFACSFVASLILGIIMNEWSFGRFIDDEAGHMSYGSYKSFDERRDENWFNPDEGRVVGIVHDISTTSFELNNSKNNFTETIIFDESIPGAEFIGEDNKVRIIGFTKDGGFVACSIFPDKLSQIKMSTTTRQERLDKMKDILAIYPECKEMFDQGRANFHRQIPGMPKDVK